MNALRAILQTETAECALACLAMVAGAHGQAVTLGDLRRRFPSGMKGATMASLMAQASALGFIVRPLRLALDELTHLRRPCILHWDLNHFVVLKRVRGNQAVVLDPAMGERRLTMAEVSRHFTGVALELSAGASFEQARPSPRLRLRQLTGHVVGLRRSLAQIFAVAAALELFALTAPLFNQLVVDDAMTSGDLDLLAVLVLGFGLLLTVQTLIGLARAWMLMVLEQTLTLQWRANLFTHLLRLPADFFERRHLGDLVSRFGSLDEVRRTLTSQAMAAVLDGLMSAAAMVMMGLYAPPLAIVTLTAVGLYALLRWAAYGPLRNAAAERLVIGAREQSHFLESIRAIVPLKLFGREDERRARWQNLLVEVQNRDVRTAKLQIGFQTLHTLITGTENLLIFWLGARLVVTAMQGGAGHAGTSGILAAGASGAVSAPLTVGMLFAFISYKSQFIARASGLIDFIVDWRMLRLHAERLADLALATPEQVAETAGRGGSMSLNDPEDGSPLANDLTHLPPTLALRNVSFRFGETEPWVLRHADVQIAAGETAALTGASGVGKTTVLKLMLGLLQPTEGEVLYGGQPVRQLGWRNVRRRIGTVMQDDALITGSLIDNICFLDPAPDVARVAECARIAQVHDDIVRMPMGYQTVVGDLGCGLSGGQRQRLLLARALYKQPGILALDEATSHLDVDHEVRVSQALRSLGLTQVMVAHRPGTIASAQRVLRVADGKVLDAQRPTAPHGS